MCPINTLTVPSPWTNQYCRHITPRRINVVIVSTSLASRCRLYRRYKQVVGGAIASLSYCHIQPTMKPSCASPLPFHIDLFPSHYQRTHHIAKWINLPTILSQILKSKFRIWNSLIYHHVLRYHISHIPLDLSFHTSPYLATLFILQLTSSAAKITICTNKLIG